MTEAADTPAPPTSGTAPEDPFHPPEPRFTRGAAAGGTAAALCVLVGAALLVGALAKGGPTGPPRAEPEVPVTATNQGTAPANNSPVLAGDPTDPRFVVMANRLDAPDFDCALQVSGNGGRGWLTVRPVPQLPEGADKCYAPEVAFDGDGVLYYLFVGLAGAGNEPMGAFLTSADRERTFAPLRQVLGPANFSVRMAIDPSIINDD